MSGSGSLVWGRADDGSVICAAVPDAADTEARLLQVWPPLGLERLTTVPRDAPAATHAGFSSWERLESDLGLFAAERLAGLVAVHAGVIAVEGSALLLPGLSLSGKSTLCAAAARLGLPVLSDEYALVDPRSGWIQGWPRSMRLRDGLGGWAAERLPVSASAALPPGLVAALEYVPGAEGLEVREVPPGDVVLALLGNTVCARSRPAEAFSAALAVARAAPGVMGHRGEARQAVDALLRRSVPA